MKQFDGSNVACANIGVSSNCMKTLLTLTMLTMTTFGCTNKETPKDEKLTVTETQQKTEKVFKQVADFPTIKDTTQFITELRKNFDLEVHESPFQKENEKITVFLKSVKS